MEEKNPIYLKLEYDESIESKKDLLSSQMLLLNLIKSIKAYHSIRLEELKIKTQIYKAVKELNLTIKKTKSSFPFLKIPEKAKRENINQKEMTPVRGKTDNNLELELQEIQKKLRNIGM